MSAPDGFDAIRLVDPFEIHVGPAYAQGLPGARRFAFRAGPQHCNLRGVVHGGMLMTFADMTLGQAVWDATDNAPSVTLNMQTQFLGPAQQGDLIEVVPELTKRTGSMIFMRGDFTVAGTLVMTAASVWKLLGRG